MGAFFKKLTSLLIIPVSWTIITIVLLSLPGSAFPEKGFTIMDIIIDIPHIDKIIHVLLFGGIVVLWSLYYYSKTRQRAKWHITIVIISLFSILLGILMEYIQLNYVPHRAFDTGDIIANTISSVLGGIFFTLKNQHLLLL